MARSRLLIRDFRNIASTDFPWPPISIFWWAPMANQCLEVIYTLGHGRAFCSLQFRCVIRHEQPEFVLHGRTDAREIDVRATSVELSRKRPGDSTVRIDDSDSHKVVELAQLLPMQLITPEGFTLLNGGPNTGAHL